MGAIPEFEHHEVKPILTPDTFARIALGEIALYQHFNLEEVLSCKKGPKDGLLSDVQGDAENDLHRKDEKAGMTVFFYEIKPTRPLSSAGREYHLKVWIELEAPRHNEYGVSLTLPAMGVVTCGNPEMVHAAIQFDLQRQSFVKTIVTQRGKFSIPHPMDVKNIEGQNIAIA